MADAKGSGLTEDIMEDLRGLKIWEKLRKGELHTITKDNVADFFRILDHTDRGEITVDELRSLRLIPDLNLGEEDIEALARDGDKDESGKLSQEELYKALTQGDVAFNIVKRARSRHQPKANGCDRETLVDWMRDEYDTMSSLCSMPSSIVLFLAFLIMLVLHLDISRAYDTQNGLKAEILGEGFPLADTDQVHDIMSLWGWMNSSFADCIFKNDLVSHPYPGRVASYNQIIGGVKLERTSTLPAKCHQNAKLLSVFDPSYGGACHKISDEQTESQYLLYQETRADIVAQLNDLAASEWLSQNSTKLDISILFLNLPNNVFTAFHMLFHLGNDGFVKITFDMETFQAEPYMNIMWAIPDVVFMVLIIRMIYSEMKELVPACLNGLDGFIDYLGFWNVIDWLSMLLALAIASMWLFFCLSVSGDLQDSITQLPMTAINDQLIQNGTWFSPAELEAVVPRAELETQIENVLMKMDSLKDSHFFIRQILFFYSFVLLMKFFKAFRANPRLNIVISTITSAIIDLIHFGLVFILIFCVFSGSAHIILGANMKQFSTQGLSMMMCFRILMGEFDVDQMLLAGGGLAVVWFLAFQVLVFLIMLNLLLAIIVDSYTAAKAKYVDPITIWSQVNKARKTIRETRGHLDLWYLICEFEDDEYPAHPLPKVTSKSLRKAFVRDKMTKGNADYCIRKTLNYLKEKEGELDLTITDAIREISKIGVQTLKIADQTESTLDMMKADRKGPAEDRLKAIWEGKEPDAVTAPHAVPGQSAAFGHVSPLPSGPPSIMPLSVSPGQLALPPQAGRVSALGSMPGTADYATNYGNSRDLTPTLPRRQTLSRSASGADLPAGGPPGGSLQTGELVAMMQQMQATMDAMRSEMYDTSGNIAQQFQEQRAFTERREGWLEDRLNQLERRSEKVERASDRLHNAFQSWDFDEMAHSQRKILTHTTKLTAGQKDKTGAPARSPDPSRAASKASRETTMGSAETSPWATPGAPSEALSDDLEKRMKGIDAQLERLLEHAEDATESRKLLWRIELNIKQLRGQAGGGGAAASGLRESASPVLASQMSSQAGGGQPPRVASAPAGDTGPALERAVTAPAAGARPPVSASARAALASAAGARAALARRSSEDDAGAGVRLQTPSDDPMRHSSQPLPGGRNRMVSFQGQASEVNFT